MLDTISWAERTYDRNGYGMFFGKTYFPDCSNHLRKRFPIPGDYTIAAGRYQFIDTTWDIVSLEENLRHFSPQSQDKGAISKISADRCANLRKKISLKMLQ